MIWPGLTQVEPGGRVHAGLCEIHDISESWPCQWECQTPSQPTNNSAVTFVASESANFFITTDTSLPIILQDEKSKGEGAMLQPCFTSIIHSMTKICGVFSETALLQRSTTPSVVWPFLLWKARMRIMVFTLRGNHLTSLCGGAIPHVILWILFKMRI